MNNFIVGAFKVAAVGVLIVYAVGIVVLIKWLFGMLGI